MGKSIHIIHCGSYEAVDNWIERLFKTGRYNYFVRFLDVRGPSLQFGWAEWAEKECLSKRYIC